MARRTGSVLFACNLNAIRSPMAEALAKHYFGHFMYVDSVGVRAGALHPLAVAAMEELGIDLSRHRPKTFDDLQDSNFDLIVSMTPEAQHRAVELTRTSACDVAYWATFDPTISEGSREVQLAAFRGVRDELKRRILERFGTPPGPEV